jgi:ubiquinone/menaquinone biosynthesis C-methylase UbiE
MSRAKHLERKKRKPLAMTQQTQSRRPRLGPDGKSLLRLVENQDIHRSSHDEHKHRVLQRYGGPQGALLYVASTISGHLATSERLLRQRMFDLQGRKSILDIGSGAGQLLDPLLKYADDDASITGCDLSANMLRRAKQRLKTTRPALLAADMVHLPFADASFDCITCGFVLEHLPDARVGLREMRRVLTPGGSMLLLVTEDSFSGAWTSRLWCCRTHNRRDLRAMCEEVGLVWKTELWATKWQQLFRSGGICVELVKK